MENNPLSVSDSQKTASPEGKKSCQDDLESIPLTPSHPTLTITSEVTDALPPTPANRRTWRLSVADTSVDLQIDHPTFTAAASTLIETLTPWRSGACSHQLRLAGTPFAWSLYADGVWRNDGTGIDGAMVELVSALMDSGADVTNRLLIVHGAGLALPDGRGLLLIAPGGAGKTTLAAALNAAGYGLLSDDVVPVTPEGSLVALGMPICFKAGSWPVLASCWPELAAAPTIQRHGQAVRFLAPRGPRLTSPLTLGLLVFPRYTPGAAPSLTPLAPEEVLRGLIEADAVIRDLTQAKLEGLARWVQSAPAYAITYPDLEAGLALVRQALPRVGAS